MSTKSVKRKVAPVKTSAWPPSFAPAAIAMFNGIKVPPELVQVAGVECVTDAEARSRYGIKAARNRDMSGIAFPYTALTSDLTGCRIRRTNPEIINGKPDNKYMMAPKPARGLYNLPGAKEQLKNLETPAVLAEGEKSALAIAAMSERKKLNIVPLATGGCNGWQKNNGEGKDSTPLPDLEVLRGHKIYVLLDANVSTNPQVEAAQIVLVAELHKLNCDVRVCTIPQLDNVNGPDDLIALHGDDAMLKVFADAKPAEGSPAKYSEDSLALFCSAEFGQDVRFDATRAKWLRWNGQRFLYDTTTHVFDMIRDVCRQQAVKCGNKNIAQRLGSAQTIAAIEKLMRADRRHVVTSEMLDADPWLLGTPGGTVDLKTGKIRPASRTDLCTKMTGATPGGDCSKWIKFLDDVTDGDAKMQRYLKRCAGYFLTGSTREHAMFFVYGLGSNGKSVFLTTIGGILNDYAVTVPIESFTASRSEKHPTDLASLAGARLARAVETEEGRRWDEAKIKTLTGADVIAARFMRCDFFNYIPQFKLLVIGNHKPGLRSVDTAMKRRMNIIPFTVEISPERRNVNLPDELRAEWPGILQWAVEGCIEWQRDGLRPPAAVTVATESYLAAEDATGMWLEECCILKNNARTLSSALYQSWKWWSENTGEFTGSLKRFVQNLEGRGHHAEHTRHGNVLRGLYLPDPSTRLPVKDVKGVPVTAVGSITDKEKTSYVDNQQSFHILHTPPPAPGHRPTKRAKFRKRKLA